MKYLSGSKLVGLIAGLRRHVQKPFPMKPDSLSGRTLAFLLEAGEDAPVVCFI